MARGYKMKFDMQKAWTEKRVTEIYDHLYPVALDEIDRQAKRISALEQKLLTSECREREAMRRIAELEEENRNLIRHYLTDDARYQFIAKQRAALKKLGHEKRERGKALVEERIKRNHQDPTSLLAESVDRGQLRQEGKP
jgi:hypothetical protein